MKIKKITKVSLFLLLALLMSAGAAHAWEAYINFFIAKYPASGSIAAGCQTCHGEPAPAWDSATWNKYGIVLRNNTNLNLGADPQRLIAIEALDSDGVGGTNLAEITAGAQPGWCNPATAGCNNRVYNRAGTDVGPGTPPAVTLDPGAAPPPPTTAPNIAVTPNTLDFGTVVEKITVQKTMTIGNTGDANLTVSAFMAGSPDFAIVTPPPATIAPTQSVDVILSYTPTGQGAASGALVIDSNDPDTPQVTVSLSGSGECAAPALQCTVSVSPQALDFGTLIQGNSNTKPVTVSNQGTADCNVTTAMTGSADFSATPASITVTPGASETLNVTYTPADVGSDAGTVDVKSNDPTQPTVSVSLSGTGEAAPPPPPVGQVAYNSNCGFCHGDPMTGGAAPASQIKVAGARVCSINAAIFGNPGASTRDSPYPAGVPGMQFLRSLSSQAIQDISTYLNSFAVTGQQRYVTACAGCHGIDARGGYTGRDVRGDDGSKIRNKISDATAMRFLSCLPTSDTDQMGNYLSTLR